MTRRNKHPENLLDRMGRWYYEEFPLIVLIVAVLLFVAMIFFSGPDLAQ